MTETSAAATMSSTDGDVLLRATGLTKTFGDLTAVDGIDFAVRRGGRRSASSAPTARASPRR